MYKCFLKPLAIVLGVYMITALGIASDIAQLSDFNLLDFLKNHSPQSYYFLITGTLLLYFLLVTREFVQNKTSHQIKPPDGKSGQYISSGDINNSTIIQIRKDSED